MAKEIKIKGEQFVIEMETTFDGLPLMQHDMAERGWAAMLVVRRPHGAKQFMVLTNTARDRFSGLIKF